MAMIPPLLLSIRCLLFAAPGKRWRACVGRLKVEHANVIRRFPRKLWCYARRRSAAGVETAYLPLYDADDAMERVEDYWMNCEQDHGCPLLQCSSTQT